METLTKISWPWGIFLIIISLMVIIIIWWLWRETLERREKNEYDYLVFYIKVKYILYKYRVCEQSYYYIRKQLHRLEQMKHKNKEKTAILWDEFNIRYEDIKERLKEND